MKTLILTHGDTDGVCSGTLALAANRDASVVFTNPVSLIRDLRFAGLYERIVISDIAIGISTAETLKNTLDKLADSIEVIYLDHHPLPEGFESSWLYHDARLSGSLLTFRHFAGDLDPGLSRVAMYGAIGDYLDNSEMAVALTKKWDKRSLYYQAGTLSQGIEIIGRNYHSKKSLVKNLVTNRLPSEIGNLALKAIEASRLEELLRVQVERNVVRMDHISYVINPAGFMSKAAIYARIYGGTPVGISAELRKSKRVYDISARSAVDSDLNRVLNDTAIKHGGHGGGHPMAGGARIPMKSLRRFLADLDHALKQSEK